MIEITTSPTAATLVIGGDLDLAERDQFPELMEQVSQLARPTLVVDMCQSSFMDSAGAGFLISLARISARYGGTTVLRGLAPRDEFVLEVCGAVDLFQIDRDHSCELSAHSG